MNTKSDNHGDDNQEKDGVSFESDDNLNSNNEKLNDSTEGSDKKQISEDQMGEKTSTEHAELGEEAIDEKYNALNDKYLRLYSDFENFRRRTAKEKLDIIKNAGGDVMREMLTILDDFERAIKANAEVEDPKTLKDGFELIHNKFLKTMSSKGLIEIKAMGEPFNVDIHEAITQIEVDKKQKGKVVDVVEKGYYLNDTVLRYAKVVVGQ